MFRIKPTQSKIPCANKSLYLAEPTVQKIDEIAADNGTSFNNVVVSMIQSCLEDIESEQAEKKP